MRQNVTLAVSSLATIRPHALRMNWRGRRALRWTLAGGAAFWLPVSLLYVLFGDGVSLLAKNVAPVAGLTSLGLLIWVRRRVVPRWGWVLAGIYVLGPATMILPFAFSRPPSGISTTSSVLLTLGICVFPPMTLWLALLNFVIAPVILVTVVLPILADFQVTKERRIAAHKGRSLT